MIRVGGTYRRLLLQILSSSRLRAQVREHAVILSASHNPPTGRLRLENRQLRDPSQEALPLHLALAAVPRLLWGRPHQPLPDIAPIAFLFHLRVRIKSVGKRAIRIGCERVIGEQLP